MSLVPAGAVCIVLLAILLFGRHSEPKLRRTPLRRIIPIGFAIIAPPMLVHAAVEQRTEGLGVERAAELLILGAGMAFMAALFVNMLLQERAERRTRQTRR
ncbi:MAG: hypothetical protein JJU33_06175 [Phycisphaerales bacterium]|nr:hypothetical protein [Phycisphaerales bacterium]